MSFLYFIWGIIMVLRLNRNLNLLNNFFRGLKGIRFIELVGSIVENRVDGDVRVGVG